MKSGYVLILLLSLSFKSTIKAEEISTLLVELDQTLNDSQIYMEKRENRISRLKENYQLEVNPGKQFDLCFEIIEEYKSYICDSALHYINKNLYLANELNVVEWKLKTELQRSHVLSSSGVFTESYQSLLSISEKDIPNDLLIDYYKHWELYYSLLSDYMGDDEQFLIPYTEKMKEIYDKIVQYLPENSPEYLFYQCKKHETAWNIEEAVEYLSQYIKMLQPHTHEYAKMNYQKSMLLRKLYNEETPTSIKYMIIAAIADTKDAIKENRALTDVAKWLYTQNDIERAFRYIQFSLNDANFFNTRVRYYQISQIMPIITEAYQMQRDYRVQQINFTLLITSVFLIILLLCLFFLYKQMKVLKKTRNKLKITNEELAETNTKLVNMNRELTEANLIKERYISYFMDLFYSGYVGKHEEFKKTIYNKIATRSFEELSKLIAQNRSKDHDLDELYHNFDKAFLNIYPTFVTDLNELLKNEEHFILRKDELLNTELRVFALIRLGINDSAKIAKFLRCSLQTVYNYRSKIKRKAISMDGDIEKKSA